MLPESLLLRKTLITLFWEDLPAEDLLKFNNSCHPPEQLCEIFLLAYCELLAKLVNM